MNGVRISGLARIVGPGEVDRQPRSRLEAAVRAGRFAVTAEITPPRSADPASIGRTARLLDGFVDAVNLTDNPSASVHMASWAASMAAMAAGVEPILQLQCRDRNRLAIQSDLLGAGAVGIPNVLLLTGDHLCAGDEDEAKAVFDLDSVQAVWMAATLRDEATLFSGHTMAVAPNWLIGAVENPFAPPLGARARRLGKKVAGGAEFVQTQYVFDVPAFEQFMAEVVDLGLAEHCAVLAGLGPVRSLRALQHLRHRVPGVVIPDSVVKRLESRPSARVEEEGVELCAETIAAVRSIPGVAGVHVMAYGLEEAIPEIVHRAGLVPPTSGGGSAGRLQDGPGGRQGVSGLSADPPC